MIRALLHIRVWAHTAACACAQLSQHVWSRLSIGGLWPYGPPQTGPKRACCRVIYYENISADKTALLFFFNLLGHAKSPVVTGLERYTLEICLLIELIARIDPEFVPLDHLIALLDEAPHPVHG